MLVSTNKSRPVYGVLKVDPDAGQHLVAAEGEGALSVLAMGAERPDFLARATIFYTAGGSAGADHAQKLRGLGAQGFHLFPAIAPLLAALGQALAKATMSTRLYVSGTEGFMGQVIQLAQGHGVDAADVLAEHRGSLARRVQCIHCKGMTDGVTTNVVACVHCGVRLLVRDHYSRRLGAFMGVAADAEAPGELPPLRELYP